MVTVASAREMHQAIPVRFSFVADQSVLSLDATSPGTCRQRRVSSLQSLFRSHSPEICTRLEADFAKRLGKFRLQRISKAVGRFLQCGGCTKGITRIQCTNPCWRVEYFRLFSCRVFHPYVEPPHRLCPSCSQKRTLLFGEYMNEQLLLRLLRCGQPLRALAVITDPSQVFKILRHLFKIAKPPPGLDPASPN
jgi:hypothetical protein